MGWWGEMVWDDWVADGGGSQMCCYEGRVIPPSLKLSASLKLRCGRMKF